MQEFVFKKEHFNYPLFIVLLQCICFVVIGNLENRYENTKMNGFWGVLYGDELPKGAKDLLMLGLIILMSRLFGYSALIYITFTTKIIIQSSKVIPTLIIGTIYMKKKHSMIEYLMGILMACGLSLFVTADAKEEKSSSELFGIMLMCFQMICASSKYVFFENLSKRYNHSASTILFWNNLFALALVIPINLVSGSFLNGVSFSISNPFAFFSILFQIICSYASNVSIVVLTSIFSAHYAVIGDAFRKFFSIVLSFIIFGRSVHVLHFYGGFVFFLAVGIQIYIKLNKKKESKNDTLL